jgi:hypothetical protein
MYPKRALSNLYLDKRETYVPGTAIKRTIGLKIDSLKDSLSTIFLGSSMRLCFGMV